MLNPFLNSILGKGKEDYLRGVDLYKAKRTEEALGAFDRALEENPSYTQAWNFKGKILTNLGKYKDAIYCFEASLNVNGNTDAYFGKGLALFYQEKYDEAIRCYDIVLKTYPDDINTWMGKGAALYYQDRFEEALRCYDKVLYFDPYNEDARLHIEDIKEDMNRGK